MSGVTTAGRVRKRDYATQHQRLRARWAPVVAQGHVRCSRCGEPIDVGQPWDLGHVDGSRTVYSGPEHRVCNRATAGRQRWTQELEPEQPGIPERDPCWRVPWLRALRRVPTDATWPRLMTVPHPRAVGSLGPQFVAWAEQRSGRRLRWWQRMAATRILEVDRDGRLVWETVVLSTARQVGKSWLLRELMLWRMLQGERFGEEQLVLNTGKDLAIVKEIQRPARLWAKQQPGRFKVREVNGQEEIESLADGSRWMLRAKEAVYGYSASLGVVDEAWKVRAASVEEGLTPTMAEREQPQLLLVSTAHRLATSLMMGRRQQALEELDEPVSGLLIVEWSAGEGAASDDEEAWRQASPHWTPQRRRTVAAQLEAAKAGTIEDVDELDPFESFRAQWLNRWPRRVADLRGGTVDLLPAGVWAGCAEPVASAGPVWVAVEDDDGKGAAVAAACLLDDGRIEVDGWLCDDWDTAMADVVMLAETRRLQALLVGASLLDRVPLGIAAAPKPVGGRETKHGLALLRDLALGARVVHDRTPDLDNAIGAAQVRESVTGLHLSGRGAPQLVKAAVWALGAAHRPAKTPAIY